MNINRLIILPDELIDKVVTPLDVKTLMLMKCVCKSWKTLISDPDFVKRHHKKQSTHLAFLTNNYKDLRECKVVPISSLMEGTSNSITLAVPSNQFYYKDAGRIVGSCNGLVCIQDCSFTAEYSEHAFSFWNFATRTKSEALVSFRSNPTLNKNINVCNFTFGYDNSTDTYKLVFFSLERDDDLMKTVIRVFTLGDNDWRDIDCLQVALVCQNVKNGVYLKSSISWCVRYRYNCHLKNLTVEQFVMISLDLGTETCTKLLLPRCCDEELHGFPTLSGLMDCLYFSYDFKKTHYVIWQMKEFGVQESWTKFLKISYTNLQQDFKTHETYYPPRLIPLCFSNNGDTLIFAINLPDQAFLYNWRDNTAKRIKSNGKNLWFSAKGYVESLVSTS
ncbi:putative F-box domain-containing protein [Medicago truncatula]|uniref:F-box protein interaction domain protein n=1 Tax=Medicago truncatula TaxID=3880 RepID=A0A072U889_MEDTR|nr:F-box protein interaction domain protein [Medicago truncatula]RHN50417.1 putative F-box domain-containing protein [Medicago truncatula]